MAEQDWWRHTAGLPPRISRDGPFSRLVALLVTLILLLASTGVLVAANHRDPHAALRRFCKTYFAALSSPAASRPLRLSDAENPDVRAALAEYERAIKLAQVSGNRRIERAFAAFEQVIDSAHPTSTFDEAKTQADQFKTTYIASFNAAVEECGAARFLKKTK